jgi:hypothetical protein
MAISDPANEIFVSAASAWEIATKFRIGRFPMHRRWQRIFLWRSFGLALVSNEAYSTATASAASGDASRNSAEPLRDVRVERAQCGGFGAFGAAGAALRVPGHHVQMRPGNAGVDKFLQVERGGDGAGMR